MNRAIIYKKMQKTKTNHKKNLKRRKNGIWKISK